MDALARMINVISLLQKQFKFSGNSTETRKCGHASCTTGAQCCAGTYPATGYDGAVYCQEYPVRTGHNIGSPRKNKWNLIQPEQCPGTWTEWTVDASATCNDTCGKCKLIHFHNKKFDI